MWLLEAKNMKSTIDEGSGAMERVVYIHHLPAPTAFDPDPTPLKCVCLCAGPNGDVWKTLHASDVIIWTQACTHTHIHGHKCTTRTFECVCVNTLTHTHTDGKLNGKCFDLPLICPQNCTWFSVPTADFLEQQSKCFFYLDFIRWLHIGAVEKGLWQIRLWWRFSFLFVYEIWRSLNPLTHLFKWAYTRRKSNNYAIKETPSNHVSMN